ncbi:L,D-transpeptidase, partial [Corynebacterium nasicanis]
PAPAAAPAAPRDNFNYGPCPRDAKVCVDIDGRRTWLQNANGKYYGPVNHAPGKPGEETPRGTFRVTRKVKDEVSYIFNNAPMPYAVYFTNNGHAFHQGNIAYESAGCVRLNQQDAQKYFADLHVGDKVFIY